MSYERSVNSAVKRDVYSNMNYERSVNSAVKRDVYSNMSYEKTVNSAVERDFYSNMSYEESVNSAVKKDVYNLSVKKDILTAFFQLMNADLQYHVNEEFIMKNNEYSSSVTRLAQTV
ncbi:hypothetical protein EMCG_05261 [[Emmonsia] crescens]|uniref:Uncharacterized protein n=1 Tax=[Emmonsia] crescens TaxID=73230 RepID=A0A0G2IXR7_9EURO|nr:hypothetical protein EMCG_05261 [Emmonsia crescens UAMH 3008]